MDQKRLLIIGGAIGALAALAGCQSSNRTAGTDPSQPATRLAAASSENEVVGGSISPIESYKQKVVREAMEGLSYDTGRVKLDAEYAQKLEGVGEIDAANSAYNEGIFELGNHNNFLGAIRAFSNAVIMRPDVPKFYAGLGQALWLKGEVTESEAANRTALDLDPGMTDARHALATILYSRGEYAEAIDEWNRVLEQDPNHAEAHGRLATALYYEGEYDGAWDHVHRAEALGYDMPAPFRALLSRRVSEPGN